MDDERLINGINILTDGLRDTANKLGQNKLRIDFLNNGIVNDFTSNNVDELSTRIAEKLSTDISRLKDNVQPLIKDFSDNYTFFINKLSKNNEYSPNNIIYVDIPSLIKYLMADEKLADMNVNVLHTVLNKNVDILSIGGLLDVSPDNIYQEFYLNINPEYKSYAEELLVNYDAEDLVTLINVYLSNTDSSKNTNIVNLFNKSEENIKEICILYLLLDHLANKSDNLSDNNYIELYTRLLNACMYRFYINYNNQIKNEILIINPFIYYYGTDPKILVNSAVFNIFLERCSKYEATNLIFACVHNERTRQYITIKDLIEKSDILDSYAKNIFALLYEKNKLLNFNAAKTKIIELFDTILIDANDEFYNIVNNDKEELKGILLNKLTNDVNYMDVRAVTDFIIRDILFSNSGKFDPINLYIQNAYKQSIDANPKEIYTTSLTKLVIDIVLSSVCLIKTPLPEYYND